MFLRSTRYFRLARGQSGYLLADLLLSAVLMGLLAAVVVPNVTAMDQTAKVARLERTLADLQKALDGFHTSTGLYPTDAGPGTGHQPVAGTMAAQVNPAARDGQHAAFWPAYLRVMPDSTPAHLGLGASPGATLFYGITGSGKAFATQVPPLNGAWTDATTPVLIQESATHTDAGGHPETLPLSAIW